MAASPLVTRLEAILPDGPLWAQGRTAIELLRDRGVDRILEAGDVPAAPGRPAAVLVTELEGAPLRTVVERVAAALLPGGVLALMPRVEGSGMWNLGRAVAGPYEALCEALLEHRLADVQAMGPHRGRALAWGLRRRR